MVMIRRKIKCFYCGSKEKKERAFDINLNTSEGKHQLKLCEKCAKDFDSIVAQLEDVINERFKSV